MICRECGHEGCKGTQAGLDALVAAGKMQELEFFGTYKTEAEAISVARNLAPSKSDPLALPMIEHETQAMVDRYAYEERRREGRQWRVVRAVYAISN